MTWTTDTAAALDDLIKRRGLSYRDLEAGIDGHSHQYWWMRLGARTRKLSLEDIEELCDFLKIDPRVLLSETRKR